jgi:AcrR family transcriptional regulator
MSDVDRTWLLDRALTCFTDRGLQATSTAYLVQATGLQKGTLYRTIHTKAALLEAVYARWRSVARLPTSTRSCASSCAAGGGNSPARP